MTTPTEVSARMAQRYDTAAQWTNENPTLLAGEIGIESDTGKWKIGNGSSAWSGLAYTNGSQISAYPLVNADIAAAAEIAVSKLANGTANQILTTDGTDVSWTDNPTIAGNVTIEGDLTVNGTTTTIDTQTLVVEDKNIELGNVTTPTDVTADGGGITLKGTTDKTINWIDSTDAWTSSERFSVPLGAQGTPSLTFTGDANTGIYSPGADQVAISTGGTGRLFIDANGNIGIGGTPTDRFNVFFAGSLNAGITNTSGTGISRVYVKNTQAQIELGQDALGGFIQQTGNYPILFYVNGAERARLTADGRVGIGNTSPSYPLQVDTTGTGTAAGDNTSIYVQSQADGRDCNIRFADSVNSSARIGYLSNNLYFYVTGNERLRIDSSGRVGIGTSSPGNYHPSYDNLVVGSTSTDSGVTIFSSTTGTGGLIFADGTSANDRIRSSITYSHANDLLNFSVNSGQSALVIDSSKRVGIGTTSPSHGLDVTEGARAKYFQILNNSYAGTFATTPELYSPASATLAIAAGGSERLRIDSSGRVGIGTSSPSSTLSVHASNPTRGLIAKLQNDSTSSQTGSQLWFNQAAVANWVIGQPAGTDAFAFWNGRADNADGSERMRLTSTGLGIGTTSPSEKFVVSNNGAAGFEISPSGTDSGPFLQAFNRSTSAYVPLTAYSSYFAIATGTSPTEKARIDSSGRLLIGTTSVSSDSTAVLVGRSDGATSAPNLRLEADFTPADGNSLGALLISQTGQTGQNASARIEARRDGGTWTSGSSMPGRLVFSTTADGASSPTERLRIESSGVLVKYGDSSTARFYPQTDNAGYIGASTRRWQAIYAVNGTIQTSDEREKTEIIDSPLGTDFIKSLRPVAYKWKVGGYEHSVDEEGEDVFTPIPGERTHWGFIAQDVKQAVDSAGVDFGGWLLDDKDDPDSQQALRYDQFIAPLTKALQEALAKIETLEAKVAALEAN